jgi:hypothetical protein
MIDIATTQRLQDLPALEARFAFRLTARLSQRSADLPHDVTERLRFAREQALTRARAMRPAGAVNATSAGGAALALIGGWGPRFAAALPVLALAAGLILVQMDQNEELAQVAAEIDAALLADDLPPAAYTDAGFLEFLKAPVPLEP